LLCVDAIEGDEKQVDAQRHPQAEDDVGNVETGKEVWSDAGRHCQSGIETAAIRGVRWRRVAEEADSEEVDADKKGCDGQCQWNSGGPIRFSEEVHGAGGHPVHERGFVEEANAVDVRGYEVVTMQHLTSNFDVDGIDIVEQSGGKDPTELEDDPSQEDDCAGARIPTTDRRAERCRVRQDVFGTGHGRELAKNLGHGGWTGTCSFSHELAIERDPDLKADP